jgi:hypothetical protein
MFASYPNATTMTLPSSLVNLMSLEMCMGLPVRRTK